MFRNMTVQAVASSWHLQSYGTCASQDVALLDFANSCCLRFKCTCVPQYMGAQAVANTFILSLHCKSIVGNLGAARGSDLLLNCKCMLQNVAAQKGLTCNWRESGSKQ